MPYTPFHTDWKNYPDTTTPITEEALEYIEGGIVYVASTADAATASAAAAQTDIDDHIADTADAHDASAISVADAGTYYSGTDVEAVLQEIAPQLGGGITAVTALPGSPSDGDEIMFMDSLTAPTYAWHLLYIAAKSSNKWQFIGGSPLAAEVATSESTTSTSYVALTTAGPSVAIPVAGDYTITIEAEYLNASNADGIMSYDIGGTGAVDGDSWNSIWANGGNGSFNARTKKKAGLTAVTLTSKYKTDAGTATFAKRRIQAVPIALGG